MSDVSATIRALSRAIHLLAASHARELRSMGASETRDKVLVQLETAERLLAGGGSEGEKRCGSSRP
jgi:hypothetical protein